MNEIHIALSAERITEWFGIPITNTLITSWGVIFILTVLANHSPLIATLKKGVVKVHALKDEDLQKVEISGGLLETSSNRTTILV